MENCCICCGEIIPEGRQVCYKCESGGIIGKFEGVPIEIVPQPSENEVIVMRFNTDKYDIHTVNSFYQTLTETFNKNRVIVLPDDISLETLPTETLIAFGDMLKRFIEESKNE